MSIIAAAVALAIPGAHAASSGDPVIDLKADLDRAVLTAGQGGKAYIRIGVTGRKLESKTRAPMNVALVIDRSGSMSGARIEAARQAALLAVDRLGRDDILAVVSYDDKVEIEVPATKVTDPNQIRDRIRRLTARGSTAIHAGMIAGAAEIRKFKSPDRVNRIILLSDGLANVGPSQPRDFADLGRKLAGEGITVSTVGLGLGYNEDLMSQLAGAADGSHAFVQEPADLTSFLAREFDDALSVVAQDVEITIRFKNGVKPIRSLGRDAQLGDGVIRIKFQQIAGGVDHVVVAEVDLPAGLTGTHDLAEIAVNYAEAGGTERRTAETRISARFDGTAEASEASRNPVVTRDVTALVSRTERAEAIKLRDDGRIEEAKRRFDANALFLSQQRALLPPSVSQEALIGEQRATEAARAPAAATAGGWDKARKVQREYDGNRTGSGFKY